MCRTSESRIIASFVREVRSFFEGGESEVQRWEVSIDMLATDYPLDLIGDSCESFGADFLPSMAGVSGVYRRWFNGALTQETDLIRLRPGVLCYCDTDGEEPVPVNTFSAVFYQGEPSPQVAGGVLHDFATGERRYIDTSGPHLVESLNGLVEITGTCTRENGADYIECRLDNYGWTTESPSGFSREETRWDGSFRITNTVRCGDPACSAPPGRGDECVEPPDPDPEDPAPVCPDGTVLDPLCSLPPSHPDYPPGNICECITHPCCDQPQFAHFPFVRNNIYARVDGSVSGTWGVVSCNNGFDAPASALINMGTLCRTGFSYSAQSLHRDCSHTIPGNPTRIAVTIEYDVLSGGAQARTILRLGAQWPTAWEASLTALVSPGGTPTISLSQTSGNAISELETDYVMQHGAVVRLYCSFRMRGVTPDRNIRVQFDGAIIGLRGCGGETVAQEIPRSPDGWLLPSQFLPPRF